MDFGISLGALFSFCELVWPSSGFLGLIPLSWQICYLNSLEARQQKMLAGQTARFHVHNSPLDSMEALA